MYSVPYLNTMIVSFIYVVACSNGSLIPMDAFPPMVWTYNGAFFYNGHLGVVNYNIEIEL